MAGNELVTEGFKEGQVGSSAMPHKMNTRSCERVNGLAVVLRGYLSMIGELAGDQWNEGDVSCSVVRRVALPDAFFAVDGLFQTFLTVLDEFGAFPAVIQRELDRYLPFLATTKVLMAAVRNGVGREAAHEAIKEAAVGTALAMRKGQADNDVFAKLGADERLGLTGRAARHPGGRPDHVHRRRRRAGPGGRAPGRRGRPRATRRPRRTRPARSSEDSAVTLGAGAGHERDIALTSRSREETFRRLYSEHFDLVLGFALRRVERPEDAATSRRTRSSSRGAGSRTSRPATSGRGCTASPAGCWPTSVAAPCAAPRSATGSAASWPRSVPGLQRRRRAARRVVTEVDASGSAPATRRCSMLHLWEGLESREIAEVLGLTTVVVRPRLSRARTRLRESSATIPSRPDITPPDNPSSSRK